MSTDCTRRKRRTPARIIGLGSGITRWAQLEAFPPRDLLSLLRDSIEAHLDMDAYHEALMLESQWKGQVTDGLNESINGRF